MTLKEINNEFPITADDIRELFRLACIVGETFRYIRIGESDDATEQTRLALEKPYLPLAAKIDELYEKVKGCDN